MRRVILTPARTIHLLTELAWAASAALAIVLAAALVLFGVGS